jgi:hypothetical protein
MSWVWDHPRHEADAAGLFGVDHAAREDHLDGSALANEAGEALSTTGCGDYGERRLR